VLAALVVDGGRICPADRLADALYGADPPPTWRKVVQGSVGRLRQVLGPHAIATVGDGYRLELGDDELDARRFERLVAEAARLTGSGEHERAALTLDAALELSSSEPMADLDGWEPGRAAAARYAEMRRLAEEGAVRELLASGQNEPALAAATELVVREPLREYRWVALALAQYRSGRQGDALRTIARARRTLVEELGLDPGPDLVALERAILAQDSELFGPADTAAGVIARCPYLGLAAYDLADADWFFGRDREVADCLAIVARTGFLAIVGASGSGKSSLARAGVAPALRRDDRPVTVVTPGHDPDAAFGGAAPGSVLLVDQLEALFVLCDDGEARAQFIAAIGAWSVIAPVIVTLRGDHLSTVAEFPDLAARVQDGLFLLGAMGESQLRAAIEVPATKVGLRLEPGLVDLLVRDVLGEPGALPLLSHALAETFERREGPVLTVAGYRAVGGVQGAVARAADSVIESLPPAGRRAAKDLFLRLVTATDLSEPVRQRIPRAALAADPTTEAVLDALVRTRLVISDQETVEVAHEAVCRAWPRLRDWLDEDRDGIRIHQHLTRAAQDWEQSVHESSELYRGARLAAAFEWASGDVELNPSERAFLEASAAQRDADERAARDQLKRQQRANRRLRGALVGVGVVLVFALIAGLVALRQRIRADDQADLARSEAERADTEAERANDQAERADGQARRADSEAERAEQQRVEADAARLAAQSGQLQAGQLPLAQLLAVEAYRLDSSPATFSGLLTAANGVPALRGYVQGQSAHLGLAFDPTGGTAITVAHALGNELAVFDVEQRAFERFVPIPPLVRVDDVALTPDRTTLVACGDGQLVMLDPKSFRRRGPPIDVGDDDLYCSLAVSPDSSLASAASGVAQGDREGEIRVIRISDGSLAGPVIPIPGDVETPAVFSADGRRLAEAMFPHGVGQWEVATGRPTGPAVIVPPPPETGVSVPMASAVAYSPDGRILAVGDTAGNVQFLAAGTLEPVGLSLDVGEDELRELAFSSDSRRLAVGSTAGAVQIFDVEQRRWITAPLRGQGNPISGLAFGSGDRTVLAVSRDGSIAIYDAAGRPGIGRVFSYGANADHATLETAVSPDGRLVAATHADGAVTVWDLATGAAVGPGLSFDGGGSVAVAFSPDGHLLAVGHGNGGVTIWRTDTWEAVEPGIKVPGDSFVVRLTFSPDGRMLAAGNERPPTVGIYDVASHRRVGRYLRLHGLAETLLRGMAVSPDGAKLVTVEQFGARVVVWDVLTGRVTQSIVAEQAMGAVFQPDGAKLLVAEAAGVVEVFDLETGHAVGEPYAGLERPIVDVQVSADGRLLAANTSDGQARLWDAHTGFPLGPPLRYDIETTYRETSLAFSPAGDSLVTAGRNGDVIAWDLDPDRLAGWVCNLAGRNLTRGEWERYMPEGMEYRKTCPQWEPAVRWPTS
jgi:WD40 repeat protein/DNA-binding SARP family transcriptional activator